MFESHSQFSIGKRVVGNDQPTYFIADIAANHDGDLERAKNLIFLAAEAGADAAKFQHFKAETIVSDHGFRSLVGQQSHQAAWGKPVFEVYKDASLNLEWTPALKSTCEKAGIEFFTSPYAVDLVDHVDPYVQAYKIGSGDITWLEIVDYIGSKKKPVIIATGASTMDDVARAVSTALSHTPDVALLQCNTNYTASLDNFRYIQLRVLRCYREMYPNMVLGLSDHTPGHATVLGAIALGARIVEKHFTDDTSRKGPDHKFSMDRKTWRDMVDRARELELALGTGVKRVEGNEEETVVLQRRAIRVAADLPASTRLERRHLSPLRPCPSDAIPPNEIPMIIGRSLRRSVKAGEYLKWIDLT